jgi:hypothetical protein
LLDTHAGCRFSLRVGHAGLLLCIWTKPLGAQVHDKLVNEAMAKEAKSGISRFSRRNWKEKYEESIIQQQQAKLAQDSDSELLQTVTVTPDDVQGGNVCRYCLYECYEDKFRVWRAELLGM